MNEEAIGSIIVDCSVKLHQALGPGLLESVYEMALCHDLNKQGLSLERQIPIPVIYDSLRFDEGFRADVIVENKVILELKSVEKVTNAHKKQLLTYLKLTGHKLGYLLNFSEALMKDGITRTLNGYIV